MKNKDPVITYTESNECRSDVEKLKNQYEQQLATIMEVIHQLRDNITHRLPMVVTTITAAGFTEVG